MSKLDEMRADLTRKYGKAQDTSGSETDNSLAAMRQRLMGKYGSAPTEPAVLPRGMGETEQPPIKQIKKSPAATQQVITGAKEGIRGQQDTRERSYAENAGAVQTVNGGGYGAALSAPKEEKPTAASKINGKAAVTGAVAGKGGAQQPVTEAEAIRQMAQQTQKEYDDYIQSGEYLSAVEAQKQRTLDQARAGGYAASAGLLQGIQTPVVGSGYAASSGINSLTPEEEAENAVLKEADRRKAAADYWKTQAVTSENMEMYNSWTAEDKALLSAYRSAEIRGPLGEFRGFYTPQQRAMAREQLFKKYGEDTVKKIAETVEWVESEKKFKREQESTKMAMDETGALGYVLSNISSVPANLVGTFSAPIDYAEQLLTRIGQYPTLNPYSKGNIPNAYVGTVRGETANAIAGEGQEGSIIRKGAALLYQGGMSAVDNIVRVAAGGKFGSLAMAAAGSFGQTVQAASAQGATPEQAIALGVINAGVEAATEYIPLDNLFKAAKAGNLKQLLSNVWKQGMSELTEEEIGLVVTTLAEAAILQEKSSYNQTIQEQMAKGKSYEEAKHFANMQILKEAGETAVVSFISGDLMEGGNELINYTGTKGTPQQGAGSPQRGEAPTQAATPKKQETAQAEQPGAKEQEAGDYATDLFTRKTTPAQPVQQITPEQAGEAIRDALDNAGVKQQIQASQETLNGMEPVADIQTPVEFSNLIIAEKMKWVIEKLRPTNYQVDRKGFGTINFSAKQLKQAFKYFAKGGADEASFEAIPYVLENGTEISSHENHKGREYSTVTFAAPVTINGKRGNMAVVVRQTTDNRYKIHRVFSPDGKAFDLSETTIEAEPTPGGGVTENGSLATPISSASDNSIANVGEIVNGQQRLDDPNGAIRQALGMESVDTQPNGQYNNGTNYGGTEYAENGEQGLSGTYEAGLPGGAGAGQNGGHDPAGLRVHGRASGDVGTGSQMVPGDVPGRSGTGDPEVRVRASGILRVSAQLRNARDNRGVRSYDLYDTSAFPQEYEQALTAGRNSDPVNGWCVTPKSAQEMAEGNVRTMMNADGTVGVGIAPDGDIVAVFKNKNGGPRGALDTAMPMAIEMGGDRLDCYGKGLVKVYENYGFIPVARVEFNPEYANDGWTPDKGTPYIYVMMHNGDSAAQVTEKMHTYRHATATELDALPTYDKDGYDDAMAYRDGLLRERGQSGDNKLYNEDGTADAGDPGESGMDHGSVGADTTKFKHETRRSKVYDNTYRNATDEDVRKVGQTAEELDPRIAEYEYISEKESLSNAELRTRNKREMNAEYTYLIKKEGWTGEDNDTAMRILKQLQKDGDVERFRALARAQKERGTTGGQFTTTSAKRTRTTRTAAPFMPSPISSGCMTNGCRNMTFFKEDTYYGNCCNHQHPAELRLFHRAGPVCPDHCGAADRGGGQAPAA